MSDFKLGNSSKKKLAGVKDITKKLVEHALAYSTVDFSVIDGLRTEEQQAKMFKEGHSELDGVTDIGDHQLGLAVDTVPYIKDIDGNHMNPFDVDNIVMRDAYLEMYRAFMRAAFKLGIVIEFGFSYNINGGRDWPHISIKGKMPNSKDYFKELSK